MPAPTASTSVRDRIVLWLPVALCLAAIFTFAARPSPVTFGLHDEDKARHLIAFGTLAGFALRAVSGSWRVPECLAAGWALGLTLVCTVAVEAVQLHIPGRSCELADIVAGMAGAVLVVALLLWARHRIARPA